MTVSILPSNATEFEKALEEACDFEAILAGPIANIHGLKYQRPLVSGFGPWVAQEYGLGPIADFFDTVEDLIDVGRSWQRIRGTPLAVETALGWISYDAILIEDQVTGRRRWHVYQIGMGRLPTSPALEVKELTDAEYLAGVSDPARSEFARGYHGYDVRGLVWGNGQWGNTLWGDDSGVRLDGGNVKWSHGRAHLVSGAILSAAYVTLGIDYENGDVLTWEAPITWETPGVTWEQVTDATALKAWSVSQLDMVLGCFDGSGNPVGYANVLVSLEDITGSPGYDDGSTYLKAFVVIPWGSSTQTSVASVSLMTGFEIAAGVKPAKQWYAPAQIDAGAAVTLFSGALAIDLMATIREQIEIVVSI